MTPLSRYHFLRKKRGTRWTSETSRKANQARWSAERARREKDAGARESEIARIEAINLPRNQGDILGTLQFTDARSGKVRRWIIRMGDRRDRITLEKPGGKRTRSHGWTWAMNQLRSKLSNPFP